MASPNDAKGTVIADLRDRTNKPSKRYRDLYDEYWGRPCGRLLNGVAYCASSVDRDDINRPLYIREAYERAWTVLQETRNAGLGRGLVWEGQPGIGKSVGLRYLLLRAFETCTPVIYCPNITKPVLIFCNDGIFAIPQEEFDHFQYLVTPILLIDSPQKNSDIPSHLYEGAHYPSCLATSPQLSRWQDYKKQTVAVILLVDLVHKYELRDILTVTVDVVEKKGVPKIIRLDSHRRPQTLTTVNVTSTSTFDVPPPLSPRSTATILPSVPSTTDDCRTNPLPVSIASGPSMVAQDGRGELESDEADESDAEEEEPAFIQLPDYVDAYWSAWSARLNYWHPITVFRLAGPSLRAPLGGVLRVTGDFCLDYFGGPVQAIPVKTLSDLYRIIGNRPSTSTANSAGADVLQLRPAAQMTHFHVFFFEKPTTNEPSSALVPPSRYIVPTLWLSQVLVAAIAEAEADLVKGLFPLFKSTDQLYGIFFEASSIRHFSTHGMQLKLLDDDSIITVSPLPVNRILPERCIPLDKGNYIGLPPERNPTWDFVMVLPDQKLFILAQITISSEHTIKPGGLNSVESSCDKQLFKDFEKLFVFVTPDEGSAKSLASKWDSKKKKRRSSGRQLAPAALSKYSIGYATYSQDELIELIHANLPERSPALPQGAFV